MTGLRFGQPAPDFTLPSTSGADITLSALRGQDVVLVFYCFDWGSIWTPELLGLVKVDPEIRQRGATILPISADSPFSHAAYAKAQGFPFPLLSDIHRTVIRAYGVLDEARNVAWRSTFVVDRDGMLRWGQVGDRQMVRDGTEILRVLDLLAQLRATWGRVRDQRKCRRSGLLLLKRWASPRGEGSPVQSLGWPMQLLRRGSRWAETRDKGAVFRTGQTLPDDSQQGRQITP
jgi:mycoredoxin-dependent peroxiredoxin